MRKNSILRRLLLVLSILMILTSSVQGTMAFLTAKTEPVVNIFVPPAMPGNIRVTLNTKLILSGDGASGYSPDKFAVILADGEGNGRTLNTVGGKAAFDLEFTADDVGKEFTYTLSMVDNNIHGVTYSDKVYTVKIKIDVNDQNELVATVTSGDDVITDGYEFEFVNICEGIVTPPTADAGSMIFWGVIFFCGVALLAGVIITDRKRPLTK